MPGTAQDKIDKLRIVLGEVDKNNSRWDDEPHLLYYYNLGRREFAEESDAIWAQFKQTTVKGATLGNDGAIYTLDPTVLNIKELKWDLREVTRCGFGQWEQKVGVQDPATQGRPYVYRRIGDAVELFFAPEDTKVLEIVSSVITTDLATLGSGENELNDNQAQGAIYYAAFQALEDDDRDGTTYFNNFKRTAKKWNKRLNHRGPRYTNVNLEYRNELV